MFSFLNPGLLWALPLASAPILLHLLFLRRARRVEFSDLTLLRAAYRRSLPSSRLRQWLLLAARCLIIACLVLAFARPLVQSGGASGGTGREEAVNAVILVDVSYSMGYETGGKSRLDLARAHGLAVLKLLRPLDKVAVGAFSDRLETQGGTLEWAPDLAAAQAALRRAQPGSRPTDFVAALRAGYGLLKTSQARRRLIVLLSDNASHGWRGEVGVRWAESVPDYDPSIQLMTVDWDDRPANAALLSAAVRHAGGGAPELSVRYAVQGPARPNWELSRWQNDRRVDQKLLNLSEREASTALPLRTASGEAVWGRLELRRDALAADDALFYSYRVPSRPKVLIVRGGPRTLDVGRGGYFLKKILLDPRGSLLPYAADVADSVSVKGLRLSDYRAVILLDFRSIPPDLGSQLEPYVRAGGGLWLIAARTDGPEAYRPLSKLLPARVGEAFDLSGASPGVKPDPAAQDDAQAARFSWRDFELQNVSVRRAALLEPAQGARILLRDYAGRPLWVSGRYGEGRVLVWGSSLDFTWTDLAVKPVFAAWLDYGLGLLTAFTDLREWRSFKVGQPIVREWSASEAAPAAVRMRGPDGRTFPLQVVRRRLEYVPQAPGIYLMEGGAAGAEEAFAVNLDRDSGEWDLRPLIPSPFQRLRPDSLTADFLRILYGREARDWVLALLLFLLAAEAWLARPRFSMPVPSGRATRGAAGALAAAALLALVPAAVRAQEGDRFVWTQVKYPGDWDPYPSVYSEVLGFVGTVTSILVVPNRRSISLKDVSLFESPFLVLAGRAAPPNLDDAEIARLRSYLTSGGFLWLEDVSGSRSSPYDRWVRHTMKLIFPDSDLTPLGSEHVIYKTFFLMRSAGGRAIVSGSLEGIDWGGRTVVVYDRNDLMGAWAKDALGHFLLECVPGGEQQRMTARKMTLNIVMYALTGSYKSDAVHQPFLLEKMRLGLTP
ncbi:MAG: DUF4159 domain-containing protein [Elusimicrobia bacterium]|nr:DUF4159 domain-containing protein [Elusimicrobiota bacterium]